MKPEQLVELAEHFAENRPFITNEETAKMSLVVPFIKLLGYDPLRPREVRTEFAAEFVQGDGKKYQDRMDFAIFDQSGVRPLIVIECKQLGADLRAKSAQLARYIAQLADLRFGIITDGCTYLFYGDLEHPNQMDKEPFFTFSLDDPKTDWNKVAQFLAKFSRDAFNADTLVTDAENSRYRQAMVQKLVRTLRQPWEDEEFMKWVTEGVYDGVKTQKVRDRMKDVVREAIEPALLRVMGDDLVDKLKARIRGAESGEGSPSSVTSTGTAGPAGATAPPESADGRRGIVTTQEELQFFETVRAILARTSWDASQVQYKDTSSYFNVSYAKPTKWFVRLFADAKRKNIVTPVPVERARELARGFEVEDAPAAVGVSRIYIDDVAQLWALSDLLSESLKTQQGV